MGDASRIHPRAGQPARPQDLVDLPHLVAAYYTRTPDPADPAQQVSFGTSGHRGSSLDESFTEAHILATSQAICEFRVASGIDGPLFLGRDTHALSEPAMLTALEVFAANGVRVLVDSRDGYTPTPAVSRAIVTHNRGRGQERGRADGVLVTPSHNPPADGGYKYNPPTGGPADIEITRTIQSRANQLLAAGLAGVRRIPVARALNADTTGRYDFLDRYVADLPLVIDLDAIRACEVRVGADPMGGASVAYWAEIAQRYRLNLTVVNALVDPAWRFMTLDWDGQIRMDCSSPFAMASLIGQRDRYDVATANDADADRHGVVTPDAGLVHPNDYLATAADYLYRHRPAWPAAAALGKTAVSSSMIDRVAAGLQRPLLEVPVGFKWFVAGLGDGRVGFGGEESAGASFLCRDGTVWTTDKDGIIACLLAAEIIAVTGESPSRYYGALVQRYGPSWYQRTDVPANRAQRAVLGRLAADQVAATELAGEAITAALTVAPGNGSPLGGLKILSDGGWFAARPSGTEELYKVYAESFRSAEHLARIQQDATDIVTAALTMQA